MLGIGIESTCDESSIAIVEDGNKLLSCKTFSQIESHAIHRGVVPEIASRAHLEKLNLLLDQVLIETKISWKDIDYVSVANRPGLLGAIMMGAQMARCISLVHNLPIVPVHHLEAHLSVVRLEDSWNHPTRTRDENGRNSIDKKERGRSGIYPDGKTAGIGSNLDFGEFPYLGILLSGGNSAIFLQEDWGDITVVGDTLDDALGEAFDKAAGILGLSYPGGPEIEKRANFYQSHPEFSETLSTQKFLLPRLLKSDSSTTIQFSFSGLKTALLYAVRDLQLDESHPNGISRSDEKNTKNDLGTNEANPKNHIEKKEEKLKNDSGTNEEKTRTIRENEINRLCYEFQEVSFELVIRNIRKAVAKTGVRKVIAGGGVLANETLRKKLDRLSLSEDIQIIYPKSKFFCTDNAAMIACLGYYHFKKGAIASLDFPISPRGNFSNSSVGL